MFYTILFAMELVTLGSEYIPLFKNFDNYTRVILKILIFILIFN